MFGFTEWESAVIPLLPVIIIAAVIVAVVGVSAYLSTPPPREAWCPHRTYVRGFGRVSCTLAHDHAPGHFNGYINHRWHDASN